MCNVLSKYLVSTVCVAAMVIDGRRQTLTRMITRVNTWSQSEASLLKGRRDIRALSKQAHLDQGAWGGLPEDAARELRCARWVGLS